MELVKEMKERFSATVSGVTRAMIQNGDEFQSFDLTSDSQRSNSKASLEDPSQLEDAITHLISDLPSPAVSEDRLSPSPMPNTQFAKAAIFSQRLPPAAAQASKIGIKKIDHYIVLQEPRALHERQVPTRSRISEQENSSGSGKCGAIHDFAHQSHEIEIQPHENIRSKDIPARLNILTIDDGTSMETCANHSTHDPPGTSRPEVSRNAKLTKNRETMQGNILPSTTVLHETTSSEVKIEQAIEILNQLEKREPVLGYLENGAVDGGAVISSDSESNHRYTLKRMRSEEDVHTAKKRRSEVSYQSTEADDVTTRQEQGQGLSCNCGTFVAEEGFSSLPVDFDRYNQPHSQPLRIAESPNSSLHEVTGEYQQLDSTAPLVISNTEDEQFADLQDLKDDTLLSPGLETNPGTAVVTVPSSTSQVKCQIFVYIHTRGHIYLRN